MPQNPNGKQLLRAAFGLFRQDPQMVWLPVLGALAGFVGFAVVGTPIVLGLGENQAGVLAALLAGGIAANTASILFQVAVVFAATDRIEGRTPTIAGSLRKAWTRKGTILEWAVLASIVSIALRLLEERAGVLARMVGFLGALGWAVATYLVLPVLAFEDVGPIMAVRRSSTVLKSRWPNVARGSLRFGALFLGWSLVSLAVVVLGVGLVHTSPYLGIPVVAIGVLALLAVVMLASTASIYLRTILYRFAMNQPVPTLGVSLDTAISPAPGRRSLLG